MPDPPESLPALPENPLSAYVAGSVRRRIAAAGLPSDEGRAEPHHAAVLFADIVGFTAAAEELARGEAGAESIKALLDNCFRPLVAIVEEHGGEISKFPGDAILALWRAPAGEVSDALRRAAACACTIQKRLDGHRTERGFRARLRIGLDAGPVTEMHVGGIGGQWEAVVTGAPLQAMSLADACAPGEVLMGPDAGERIADGVELVRTAFGARVVSAAGVSVAGGVAFEEPDPALLSAFLPKVVRARLSDGQSAWLGELRRVTAVFVRIDSLSASGGDLPAIHSATRAIQEAVARYGGSVNQVLMEVEGLVAVLGWGLALSSHDDDAARACRAAREIHGKLGRTGLDVSIGISTARVFTGSRGGDSRREYAMIGNGVNLAARLMQSAGGKVICDEATRSAARQQVFFEELGPVAVKGIGHRVETFRPLGIRERRAPGQSLMVGRAREKRLLRDALTALEREGVGALVSVEGEPGIGKSILVEDFLAVTRTSSVRTLIGGADALERATPYYAWRPIFESLLGLERVRDAHDRFAAVGDFLEGSSGDLRRSLPLLRTVLGLACDEDAEHRDLTDEARAALTRGLLLELLRAGRRAQPALIVIEDVHWLDSASWALLENVLDEPALLIVVATRPFPPRDELPERRRVVDRVTMRLAIGGLTADESRALVCHRLDVDSLPEAIAALIHERGEGQPYFVEQLALALRERGVIRIEEGRCFLVDDAEDLDQMNFPTTVQGVVTGRIDALSSSQQMTLKVASVLGRHFDLEALAGIHPFERGRVDLGAELAAMSEIGLLEAETSSGGYRFQHALTEQVAYELLPLEQRRELHHAVAGWLERERGTAGGVDASVLAYHWTEAMVPERAVDYLEEAGESALSRDANREAVGFFGGALQLLATTPLVVPAFRRAGWRRRLGEAHWRLGNLDSSQGALHQALQDLGTSLPTDRAALIRLLAKQLLVQIRALWFRGTVVAKDPTERELCVEAAASASLIAWQGLVHGSALSNMTSALLASNLADRGGSSSVIGLALLGVAASSLGLRKRSLDYLHRAREDGVRLGHLREVSLAYVFSANTAFGRGEIESATELLDEGLPISERIGYAEGRGTAITLKGVYAMAAGEWKESEAHAQAALELLGEEPRHSDRYWLYVWASALVYRADAQAADRVWAEQSDRFEPIEESEDKLWIGYYHSGQALVALRTGNLERCRREARLAADATIANPGLLMPPALTVGWLIETYMALWERSVAAGSSDAVDLADTARRLLRVLARRARSYPCYRPRVALLQGQLAWMKGDRDRALRTWTAGMEAADEPYYEYERLLMACAVAQAEADEARRAELLSEAEAFFTRAGGALDLERIEAIRGGGSWVFP